MAYSIENDPYLIELRDSLTRQLDSTDWSQYGIDLSPQQAAQQAPQQPAGPSAQDSYYSWLRSLQEGVVAEQRRQDRATASSFLAGILSQYGMGDLAGNVDSLINEWGTNSGVIAEKLRQTDSYKSRFKGLINLQSKGVTDVRNEAQYIELESRYRQTFRDAGLQSYLGDAGSRTEQDAIARIVGDFSLSVNEVNDRIRDAQRIVGQDTPAEVRQMAERYYGIKDSDMVAYTLKLDNSTERINQMANAAIVGGLGANRYGLDIDRAAAELAAAPAQGQDIAVGQLSAGLAESQVVRDATKRLADIDQDTLTDSEVVRSQIGNDATAQTKVKKLQSRERARFSGTSGVTSSSLAGSGGV